MDILKIAVLATATAAFAADQQFATLGDHTLESGQAIRAAKIGYRAHGTLNAQKSNAIVFPTWFGGTTENLEAYIGPGKMVDSSKYFVVTVDALGNGVSSSPSNGQQPFPRFTIRDMVNSQHRLLTEKLGIQHLYAVVGISMGGMQTFTWISAYPGFADRAVPIVGSPRLASTDMILWQAQLSAIEAAEKCRCDMREAMKTVALIHQFALYTPDYRFEKTPNADFPKLKTTIEAGANGRMKPEDWASQLRAMMSTNIGDPAAAAKRIKARTLVVVARQDHMVHPGPALDLAKAMNAPTLILDSNCGHLALGCETPKLNSGVSAFLAK